jgi:hypothetical protein
MKLIYLPIIFFFLSFNGAASLNIDANHYNACLDFQKTHQNWNTVLYSDDNFTQSVHILNYNMADSENITLVDPANNTAYFEPLDMFYNEHTATHFFVNNDFLKQNVTGIQDNTVTFIYITNNQFSVF